MVTAIEINSGTYNAIPSPGDRIRLQAHDDRLVVYRRMNLLDYIAEYGLNLRDELAGLHKLGDVFENSQNPPCLSENPVLDAKLDSFVDG